MRYKSSNSPEEYLEFVLKNWKNFKEHNGGICRAIKELLDKFYELQRKERNNFESN